MRLSARREEPLRVSTLTQGYGFPVVFGLDEPGVPGADALFSPLAFVAGAWAGLAGAFTATVFGDSDEEAGSGTDEAFGPTSSSGASEGTGLARQSVKFVFGPS